MKVLEDVGRGTQNFFEYAGGAASLTGEAVSFIGRFRVRVEEDSKADVDMNVAMTGAGAFVEVQGTAEARPFTREQLDTMLGLAQSGIEELFAMQRAALDAARGA